MASGVTAKYPAPTQPTFCRLLQRVDARKVEEVILAIQEQMRGPAPKGQLIVLDGKEPKHGSGASNKQTVWKKLPLWVIAKGLRICETRVAEVQEHYGNFDFCGSTNLMSGIYLSYRRMDAAGHAGHRFDPLSRLSAQEGGVQASPQLRPCLAGEGASHP